MSKCNSLRLMKDDIEKPCKELATFLLGKILVRQLNENILKGRIVETEAYLGGEDRGSHSYNGRKSAANEPMYMPAGTCYVYMIFGIHHCLNISSKEPGAAVLLRALEPINGIEHMDQNRAYKVKTERKYKIFQLCNGPSKLCIAMDIRKDNCNKLDITDQKNDLLWIEDDPQFDVQKMTIISSPRIGINYAGAWIFEPLRYYILNNDSVSKRDKKVEKELVINQ